MRNAVLSAVICYGDGLCHPVTAYPRRRASEEVRGQALFSAVLLGSQKQVPINGNKRIRVPCTAVSNQKFLCYFTLFCFISRLEENQVWSETRPWCAPAAESLCPSHSFMVMITHLTYKSTREQQWIIRFYGWMVITELIKNIFPTGTLRGLRYMSQDSFITLTLAKKASITR